MPKKHTVKPPRQMEAKEKEFLSFILVELDIAKSLVDKFTKDNLTTFKKQFDKIRLNSLDDQIERELNRARKAFFSGKFKDDDEPVPFDERVGENVQKTASSIQRSQFRKFKKDYSTIIGVDPISSTKGLQYVMDSFVKMNVQNIRSIHEDYFDSVERVVMDGLKGGRLAGQIAEDIKNRYDITQNQAVRIARTETGKLYNQLEMVTAQSNGIETYIWHTSIDGRESADHRKKDGEIYRYDKPPYDEDFKHHVHPADRPNCRCWAEPNYAEILEAA